jgi:serine/threonine-protein kinase
LRAYARDPDFVGMMLDEARLASRIRHPNVVSVLDVVTDDDELLIVMEYVHGESLANLRRTTAAEGAGLPLGLAVHTVAGVFHGLHAAHEARSERGEPLEIIHRDVSPQNVLVGIDGIARLIDFGMAKATGHVQVTHASQLKGKLAYMAPEQIARAPVDRRVDIYAASVVLWESLTGRRLIAGETEVERAALCASYERVALRMNVSRFE